MPIEQPWNGRVKVGNRLRIDMFGSVFGSDRPSEFGCLDNKTGVVVKVHDGTPIVLDEKKCCISLGSADSYELKLDVPIVVGENTITEVPVSPGDVTFLSDL
jgi:hypothetical protein